MFPSLNNLNANTGYEPIQTRAIQEALPKETARYRQPQGIIEPHKTHFIRSKNNQSEYLNHDAMKPAPKPAPRFLTQAQRNEPSIVDTIVHTTAVSTRIDKIKAHEIAQLFKPEPETVSQPRFCPAIAEIHYDQNEDFDPLHLLWATQNEPTATSVNNTDILEPVHSVDCQETGNHKIELIHQAPHSPKIINATECLEPPLYPVDSIAITQAKASSYPKIAKLLAHTPTDQLKNIVGFIKSEKQKVEDDLKKYSSQQLEQVRHHTKTNQRHHPTDGVKRTKIQLQEWRNTQRKIRNRASAARSRAHQKNKILALERALKKIDELTGYLQHIAERLSTEQH